LLHLDTHKHRSAGVLSHGLSRVVRLKSKSARIDCVRGVVKCINTHLEAIAYALNGALECYAKVFGEKIVVSALVGIFRIMGHEYCQPMREMLFHIMEKFSLF